VEFLAIPQLLVVLNEVPERSLRRNTVCCPTPWLSNAVEVTSRFARRVSTLLLLQHQKMLRSTFRVAHQTIQRSLGTVRTKATSASSSASESPSTSKSTSTTPDKDLATLKTVRTLFYGPKHAIELSSTFLSRLQRLLLNHLQQKRRGKSDLLQIQLPITRNC